MNGDNVSRLLLLGILICLVVLAFQGIDEQGAMPRYQVTGTRAGAPLLIRTDTVTGKVWKLELRGGDDQWELFAEADESAAGEEDAQARTVPEAAEPPVPATETLVDDADDVLAESPAPQGPRIKFAPRKPPPTSPSAASDPAAAPLDLDSFADAIGREDVPVEIRVWAVGQLRTVEDPRATDLLLEALRSGDERVSGAAAEALEGRDDDPRVAEALEHAEGR